jgi:hypothetical protein
MTKVPSPLRAPAEIESEHASAPTNHRNSRCKDCGAPLDVWKCCLNASADAARLGSSVNAPLYCGKPSKGPWQFGVDMPGVGRVPASYVEPQATRSVDVPAVGLPESLKTFVDLAPVDGFDVRLTSDDVLEMRAFDRRDRERNRHLSQLIFAARDLAESRIMRAWKCDGAELVTPSWCRECHHNEMLGSIVHASDCKTGRVLDILLQLVQTADPAGVAKCNAAANGGAQ